MVPRSDDAGKERRRWVPLDGACTHYQQALWAQHYLHTYRNATIRVPSMDMMKETQPDPLT